MKNINYGVIIGRFQCPYLTKGHKFLFESVLTQHKNLIVLVGNHQSQPTERNPLDFITRKLMIQSEYSNAIILPLKDETSDLLWSAGIDTAIESVCKKENCIIYCSRDGFIKHYSGSIKTKELYSDLPDNASEIRKLVSGKSVDNQLFREGVIYGLSNRFPSPYIAVDIAMIKEGEDVLLGKKKGEVNYRFIGGFVDSLDESILLAAKRELLEETGRIEADEFELIGEAKIDDWRYKRDKEKIFTVFFKCKYIFGRVRPMDDIDKLEWVKISDLPTTIFVEPHKKLQQILINNLKLNK